MEFATFPWHYYFNHITSGPWCAKSNGEAKINILRMFVCSLAYRSTSLAQWLSLAELLMGQRLIFSSNSTNSDTEWPGLRASKKRQKLKGETTNKTQSKRSTKDKKYGSGQQMLPEQGILRRNWPHHMAFPIPVQPDHREVVTRSRRFSHSPQRLDLWSKKKKLTGVMENS